jgi:pimeloyl-ACP methyl ester carboxylesterase
MGEVITPFRVDVSDEQLADLHARLDRTRLPGGVAGAGWGYGTEPGFLADLVAYWRSGYDWRAAERGLNAIPQFTAEVERHPLHFVHVRGRGPDPLPLVFCHGWPGSFWEVHKVLGPLTDPAAHGGDPADAFDVIAPSLPGYGFSPDPGEPGMHPGRMAELIAGLTTDVLGYRRFGLQGGDWGSLVTSRLAYAHPDRVVGLHLTMAGIRPTTGEGAPPLTEAEQAFLATMRRWHAWEGGYQDIQGTKPQSLAYALTDSPAGLAAWIVEKFRAWSDCDGNLTSVLTMDELLTNIMVYWVSGCIGSSMRLYFESRRDGWRLPVGERIEVPTGLARFPAELSQPPREWVERAYRVERWTEFPRGGHFAAMEQPVALVAGVREFFRPLRSSGGSSF